MTEDKIYCGSGIEKFDGDLVDIVIDIDKVNAQQTIFEYSGKRYIKLKVVKKRETDQYGKTHYVQVDTWEPEKKEEEHSTANSSVGFDDEIPF
tara:strand:+ start:3954 stop:4232 length:279 start_codon:yes stop_codon:yes gene_type:complete